MFLFLLNVVFFLDSIYICLQESSSFHSINFQFPFVHPLPFNTMHTHTRGNWSQVTRDASCVKHCELVVKTQECPKKFLRLYFFYFIADHRFKIPTSSRLRLCCLKAFIGCVEALSCVAAWSCVEA